MNFTCEFSFKNASQKEIEMYEFKHHSSEAALKRRSFEFRVVEKLAVSFFGECPNFQTLVHHADKRDISPVHCRKGKKVIDFFVPKQKFLFRTSSEGLRFSIVKVIDLRGIFFWLVVCEQYRQGFLLPMYVINAFGNIVRTKRGKPCKFVH
jgi:hypothetical protein